MTSAKRVLAYSCAASMLIFSLSSLLDAAQKGRPMEVVETQSLRITDANGKLRARLEARDGVSNLSLYDASGASRVSLTVSDDGRLSGVWVGGKLDADPTKRTPGASLAVTEAVTLNLHGDNGTVLVAAGVKEAASPTIEIYDPHDRVIFHAQTRN